MSDDYLLWAARTVKDGWKLKKLQNVEDRWELREAVSRIDNFPREAVYEVDSDFPNRRIFADNLSNPGALIVGSAKLQKFLKARKLAAVEYLPVRIANVDGKPFKEVYFIVHPVEPVECLDLKKSGAKIDKFNKDVIESVKKLVLDKKRIDPKRELFRAKRFYDVIFVRRELAESLDEAGFSGLRWIELSDYPEI